MNTDGEDPTVRNLVGEALSKVTGIKNSDLAYRNMSSEEENELRTGQTEELVVIELMEQSYDRSSASEAVESTIRTNFI